MKCIVLKLSCMLSLGLNVAYGYTSPIEGGTTVTLTNNWIEPGIISVGASSDNNNLYISSGWDLSAGELQIGGDYFEETEGADNLVQVSGAGSTVESATIVIGDTGENNRFEVLSGGSVLGEGTIGYEATAINNSITVSGTGSIWSASALYVGDYGSDNLMKVMSGGLVVSEDLYIGVNGSADGNRAVISSGSVWSNIYSVYVGASDNVNNLLTIENGGILATDELSIDSGGSVQLLAGGRLLANSVYGSLNVSGIYAPGVDTGASSATTLTLNSGATLEMQIGGLGGTNSDHLAVSGSASLNGVLKVVLASGFVPEIDDTFDLFDWAGSLSGTFSSMDLPVLAGEKGWDTSRLYTEGKLFVVFGPADLDGNGIADAWEQAYFEGTADPDGNPDNDVQNNLQEYIAGTDPTNSASFFQVTHSEYNEVAGGFVVQWPVISNRYYTVSWLDDLVFGTPSNLLENAELPQNSYTDTVHSADSQGFYTVDVRTK